VPTNQISSITTNNNLVTIKTLTPLPNFPVLLAQIPILSQSQFKNKRETDFPIGSGAFKLTSFDNQKDRNVVKEQTIVLEQNKEYFGTKSRVKKLIYRYINQELLSKLK